MKTSKLLLGMLVTGAVLTTTVSCKKDDAVDPKKEEVKNVTESLEKITENTTQILASTEGFETKTTTVVEALKNNLVGNTETAASLKSLTDLETSLKAAKTKVEEQIKAIDIQIGKLEGVTTRATVEENAENLLKNLKAKRGELAELSKNLTTALGKMEQVRTVHEAKKLLDAKDDSLEDNFNTEFGEKIESFTKAVLKLSHTTEVTEEGTKEVTEVSYDDAKKALLASKTTVEKYQQSLQEKSKKIAAFIMILEPKQAADAAPKVAPKVAETTTPNGYEALVAQVVEQLKERKNDSDDLAKNSNKTIKFIETKVSVGDLMVRFDGLYVAYTAAVTSYDKVDASKEAKNKARKDFSATYLADAQKLQQDITDKIAAIDKLVEELKKEENPQAEPTVEENSEANPQSPSDLFNNESVLLNNVKPILAGIIALEKLPEVK